jgi:ABC-type lipoprotein export system ATPase subunit
VSGGWVLEVDSVGHRHPGTQTWVLRDVRFRVAERQIVALAGRSGSGKSTLCHLVAGFTRPAAGRLLVAGVEAHALDDWQVRAFLPQRLAVAGELTVAENVALPLFVRGREPAVAGLLEALDLQDVASRPVSDTSLGEQQRTALARALALDPALVVLDEPTGHQDDDHVALVLAALVAARDRGAAVLVATHDERVLAAAARVLTLVDGWPARGADEADDADDRDEQGWSP